MKSRKRLILSVLLVVTTILLLVIPTYAKAKPSINKKKATIRVCEKLKLSVKNAKKVTWESSNNKIAAVKKGVVTPKKAGTVTITAKVGKQKLNCKVVIKDHKFKKATCTEPKTCTICGATEGSALGHDFVHGECTRCHTEGGTIEVTIDNWQDYFEINNEAFLQWDKNAFGEITSLGVFRQISLKLKDKYNGNWNMRGAYEAVCIGTLHTISFDLKTGQYAFGSEAQDPQDSTNTYKRNIEKTITKTPIGQLGGVGVRKFYLIVDWVMKSANYFYASSLEDIQSPCVAYKYEFQEMKRFKCTLTHKKNK